MNQTKISKASCLHFYKIL